jgi:hypothetical protein
VAQAADDEDGQAGQTLPKQQQHGRETVEIAGRIGHDGVEMPLHGPLEAGFAFQGGRVEVKTVFGFFVEQKRPVFVEKVDHQGLGPGRGRRRRELVDQFPGVQVFLDPGPGDEISHELGHGSRRGGQGQGRGQGGERDVQAGGGRRLGAKLHLAVAAKKDHARPPSAWGFMKRLACSPCATALVSQWHQA